MPRTKPPTRETSAVAPVSSTGYLFSPRKTKDRPTMTSERIAADLKAFREGGGKIELLGVTRSLRKIDPDAPADPPRPAHPLTGKSRR